MVTQKETIIWQILWSYSRGLVSQCDSDEDLTEKRGRKRDAVRCEEDTAIRNGGMKLDIPSRITDILNRDNSTIPATD